MYDAQKIEEKWKKYWKEKKTFLFDEKKNLDKVFSIDTPPPFTNGDLHMGQIFWVSYIDSVARYEKMRGYNVLYPQGWDAHGFPTELAVEKKFGRKLSREDFYKKCVELSTENIKKMREQMLQLGSTFDERYEYTTTSTEYLKKTQLSLIDMYEKKMFYRAAHPVMWCTRDVSGISNPEVDEKEEESLLNHIKFKVEGSKDGLIIATSRPEMLHACVAIAVNPNDKRYKKIIGKSVVTPIYGKEVEIIGDEKVDQEFGTGAEMICTFGDKADVEMYLVHKLNLIEAIYEDGKIKNSEKYDGLTLDEARAAIIKDLEKAKVLVKQEKIKHVVKVHDRCGTRVEYINSKQWFIRIKEHSCKIKEIANEIKWYPDFTRQRLYDWANFIEWDWNISRNRIFGAPIPFWSCEKCDFILAAEKKDLPVDTNSKNPKTSKCPECGGRMVGTKDTCDSWVETSITPLAIAGWPDNKELVKSAFPNSVRIQGTDIIRTWAFSTIFRSYFIGGNKPWENIICHGMILGLDGREMHKRFGNGIYLPDLMPKYSADMVRLWVALSGGIGKDKQFSYAETDFAKSFVIKLFNSANFVKLALEKGKIPKEEPHKYLNVFDLWILSRLNQTVKEVTEAYDEFNLNIAMNKAINFYWHEFADYYIENVKHRVYSEDKKMEHSKEAALFTLRHVLETSLRMFAPVIPFVSEEINSELNKGSIFEQKFPVFAEKAQQNDFVINGLIQTSPIKDDYENVGALLNNVIAEVRKEKAKNRLALNKEITAININVPDEYYNAVVDSTDELKQILKAHEIKVIKKKEFSVSIKI